MNDIELVKMILAGDEERFGEIVDHYARKVWALCASYVHNPSDCEDLVQESYVRSYLRLNTIRERKAFGAWLGQIARTRCLEWLRKRSREKTAVANLETNAPEASTEALPSESAQREEMRAFVRRNLDALPDKYREALYLYYIGGHSVAEAARFLDISESAMKKRLQLGREKLREQAAGAIEEALGEEKPREDLDKTVLAAIPFGNTSWLAEGRLVLRRNRGPNRVFGFTGGSWMGGARRHPRRIHHRRLRVPHQPRETRPGRRARVDRPV
ncbi:MAG: RNA polymerase sigma factor [Candidatus Hydrogenedentes bacterium]|nr:RNA polymerase sigma factor [Candidatus Hydrogenedentota bacterium]